MKIKKVDSNDERLIIIGLITSTRFVKGIESIIDLRLFTSTHFRIIAGWCLKHHEQYHEAPRQHIKDIYDEQASQLDDTISDLISDLLGSLSTEYEQLETELNIDYMLDKAQKFFATRSLAITAENISALISQGDVEKAEQLLSERKPIQLPRSVGIDPLGDEAAITAAFVENEGDALFKFPGELGEFIGPVHREDLIGIMAPEKRGKTFWLQEFALRARRARRRVAWFIIGDMSEREVVRRVHARNAKHPIRARKVRIPLLDCLKNQKNECRRPDRSCSTGVLFEERNAEGQIVWVAGSNGQVPSTYKPCTRCSAEHESIYYPTVWHKEKEFGHGLPLADALMKGQRVSRLLGHTMRLICLPSDSISVKGIRSQLDLWEYDKIPFIPDVIVVDYADNLAPEDRRSDFRHQQNSKWQGLKALAQGRRCAVITGTQADARSYSAHTLKAHNFSEDKRKYSHVNMMLTLNQTDEEKALGVMRVGKMFVRGDEADYRDTVSVLECRAIGQIILASYKTPKKI